MKKNEIKAYIAEVKSRAKEQYEEGNYPTQLLEWIEMGGELWRRAQPLK